MLAVTSGVSWGVARYKEAPAFWQWFAFTVTEILIGLSTSVAILRFGPAVAIFGVLALLVPVAAMVLPGRLPRQGKPLEKNLPSQHGHFSVSEITPSELRREISSVKPFMRDEFEKHFIGMNVEWTGQISSVTRHDARNTIDVFVTCDGANVLAEEAPVIPGIKLLDKDAVVTVTGPISSINAMWITVRPASLVIAPPKS